MIMFGRSLNGKYFQWSGFTLVSSSTTVDALGWVFGI
jgi:hypothetical protein